MTFALFVVPVVLLLIGFPIFMVLLPDPESMVLLAS